ncbi:hypothetical protein GCM10009609_45760 [Pseudonocardia aurantiaca]
MSSGPVGLAHRLLTEAVDALSTAAGPAATDDELLSMLTLCKGAARRLDRLVGGAVAELERRGTFAERGYKSAAVALADLLGWEQFEARRRVTAAEQVCQRAGLDGTVLPARLAATAEAFAAARTDLRHVEVIARVLASPPAARLAPQVWAGAEAELAVKSEVYTPSELQAWGSALVEALDQDGAEPDDGDPAPVNELRLTRLARGGGKLAGRFEDAATFDAIAAVIDAEAKPLDADDPRNAAQRQADALADVCGFVLDQGDSPSPAAAGRISTCWCGWRTWRTAAGPRCSTSAAPSPRARCGCSPATPPWSLSSWAPRASPSTSAGRPAPSPTASAGPWPRGAAGASTPAAGVHRPGARSTTSFPGRRVGRRRSTTAL